MKRLVLIVSLLLALSTRLYADSNYLHVATEKGWEVIDIEKADRLTFSDGKMNVLDVAGNNLASFPQSSLDQMYVDQSTGVQEISLPQAHSSFTLNGNGRLVEALANGAFEVYSLDGKRLVMIPAVSIGQTISLSGLQNGCYVYKLGEYSVKVVLN